MPFLLTVRVVADDGHQTPLRQAKVTAYAIKQPVVLRSDGSQIVHQPESALTDDTGFATLTLYRSSEVLTPSDWAVTIDSVTWSGPVPETPDTAASILEMVESYGWGIIAGAQTTPVTAIAGQGVPTGGVAGQILVKNSNANYDATWEDAPARFRGLIAALQTTTVAADGAGHALKIDTPTFASADVSATAGQPSATINTDGLYRVQALAILATSAEAVQYRMSDLSDEVTELPFGDANIGPAGRLVFLKAMTVCNFDVGTANNDFAVRVFNEGTDSQDFFGYLIIEYLGPA